MAGQRRRRGAACRGHGDAGKNTGRRRVRRVCARVPDEPVPAAMRGLDVLRRLGVVAHRLAKLPDAGLEHRIADVGRGPDAVEQLLLGHQLARVLDEKPQDGKRLRPQRDPLRAFPQAFIRQVETKSTECDLVGWLHHGNITATARLRYDRPRSCPLFSTRDVRNANAIGTQGGCDVSANSSALANGSAATRSDVRRALGSTCVRAEGCACHGGWHRNNREQWRPAGGVPRRNPVLRGATNGLADGYCRRLRRAPALERQPARLINPTVHLSGHSVSSLIRRKPARFDGSSSRWTPN